MSEQVNPELMKQLAKNKSAKIIGDMRTRLRQLGSLDSSVLQEAARDAASRAQEGTWDATGNFVPQTQHTAPVSHSSVMSQMKPVHMGNQNYSTIEVVKERQGREISTYQIRESNGQRLDLKFRRKSDSDMACAILNETGQINDPRLTRMMQLINQENELIKKKSKTITEAKMEKNPTRRGLLVDRKKTIDMQIENIRIKLGVNG